MKYLQFLVLAIFLISISCKKDEKKIIDTVKKNQVYENNVVKFQFIFPDTVYINKTYNGKIKYKGILDSITTKFNFKENTISRYILFSNIITKNVLTENQLRKMKLDTIGALNNTTIPLRDIKFNELGTFYIDGILNDNVFIPLNIKDNDGDYLTRSITNESRATHKVVVVENPNL